MADLLTIHYGTAERQPEGPSVSIDRAAGTLLRLNNSSYSFGEIRGGGIGATTAERLAFLRDHLTEQCDLWAKRPRQFVDLYFRFIQAQLERDATALDERLRRFGGLFARDDYAFSALRPLPRAHLAVSDDAVVRVDFAFWTGTQLVAVDIVSDDAREPSWDDRRRRLDTASIRRLEIPAAAIARNDPAVLSEALPGEFAAFWRSEAMPSSPFKVSALGELRLGTPDF